MVQINELIGNLPPVTKILLSFSTLFMILCSVELMSPLSLYLNWTLVFRWQVWRLVTCFLYFGTFGLHFFWNSYVLIQYCSSLEEVVFRGRSADFLWMLMTTGGLMLLSSYIFGSGLFYGNSLVNVMTYIWGRHNPSMRMNILFFTVRVPYLPWVLGLLGLLMGWNLTEHILGILIGHTYYFFEEIYPLMPTSKGIRIFATPKLLKRLVHRSDY
eukprot:GHVU01120175.1.p1 GENE.GHVU01120175.1~~GHVU01120175.1.p1  ORF type:complete len:214 (+),score=2.50 GHVU01120175.1:139-780(+)